MAIMITLQKNKPTKLGRVQWIPRLFVLFFLLVPIVPNFALADIADDIQALTQFSGEAKSAGYRLLNEGLAILPAAHSTIIRPQSSLQQKMQLMTVLGEIGDASSVDPVITAANQHPNNSYLKMSALHALAQLPQSPSSFKYAAQQLRTPNSPQAQRTALWYFAEHKDRRAIRWATQYSADDADPRIRDAGLYAAAALGETSVKTAIVEMLNSKLPYAKEVNLLLALTYITSVQEFTQLTQNLDQQTRHFHRAARLVRFRRGSASEKFQVAREILRLKKPLDTRLAIEYLVEQGAMDELAPLMADTTPKRQILIKNKARKLGYQTSRTRNGIKLTK